MATAFTWHYSSINLLNTNWNTWGGDNPAYLDQGAWANANAPLASGMLPKQNGDSDWMWNWCNPDPNVNTNCKQGPRTDNSAKGDWTNWPCPCQDVYGHCAFCDLKWAKLITVLGTFNILYTYFTAFAAVSWYAEGAASGSNEGEFVSNAIVSKQPDMRV